MITRETLEQAHDRIRPYIHRTPILTSTGLDELSGCSLYFKCENFQKIGAFKARGALNAVLSLSAEQRAKGIATHSSGNHAQAVARAARMVGVPAFIVMPKNAPEIKKTGVRAYGGQIFECEPTTEARERMLDDVLKQTGAALVHPFNDYAVIAGQGTAAKELIEDAGVKLDVILTPVGGGGLLSGTLLAVKFFSPGTEVVAGEPEGSDDAWRSLQSGKIEPAQSQTIADGLLTSLGDKTFPIIRDHVKEIITVTDAEIVEAMRLIWERMKIIIEPSCAVPFATVLKAKEKFAGKKVGIILSGGNVDLERACKLMTRQIP